MRAPLPGETPAPFGGPRSLWGSRLARAVHAATRAGADLDRARRAEGPVPVHHGPLPSCTLTQIRPALEPANTGFPSAGSA